MKGLGITQVTGVTGNSFSLLDTDNDDNFIFEAATDKIVLSASHLNEVELTYDAIQKLKEWIEDVQQKREEALNPKVKIISLDEDVDEYDMMCLVDLDFEYCVYSYKYGSYEGDGFLVAFNNDESNPKFSIHDMSHCSCYGPFGEPGDFKLELDIEQDPGKWLNKHFNHHKDIVIRIASIMEFKYVPPVEGGFERWY